jgi:hypothetical protein
MKHFYNFKNSFFLLLSSFIGLTSFAQVDMVASVDVTPPVTNGQTFNYTLGTVSAGTVYNAVRVKITYDENIIQLNSFTPSGVFNLTAQNDTSVPGVILYDAAKSGANLNDNQTIFTAEFEVLDSGQNIIIVNDANLSDGAFVSNPVGNNVLGTTNDIDFSTLSTEDSELKNSLSIYPNPAKDNLNIKLNRSSFGLQSIKINSIDGKLVKRLNVEGSYSEAIRVDISDLRSAMYFMTIISEDDRQANYKFVVK